MPSNGAIRAARQAVAIAYRHENSTISSPVAEIAAMIDRETQINELADALSWLLEELGDPACPNLPSVEAMAEAKSVIDQVKGGE